MAGATRSWSTGRDVIAHQRATVSSVFASRHRQGATTTRTTTGATSRQHPRRGGAGGADTIEVDAVTWFRRGEEFTGTMRPLTFQFHDAPRPRGSLGPKVPIYS